MCHSQDLNLILVQILYLNHKWVPSRADLCPKGVFQYPKVFFIVTTGRVLLAYNGKRLGMLLTSYNFEDKHSQQIIWPQTLSAEV